MFSSYITIYIILVIDITTTATYLARSYFRSEMQFNDYTTCIRRWPSGQLFQCDFGCFRYTVYGHVEISFRFILLL